MAMIGHESNACPHPRTTESRRPILDKARTTPRTDMRVTAKQCYHCQGYGHVQADCPTLRISGAGTGGRCYTCGQPGHLAVSVARKSVLGQSNETQSAPVLIPVFKSVQRSGLAADLSRPRVEGLWPEVGSEVGLLVAHVLRLATNAEDPIITHETARLML